MKSFTNKLSPQDAQSRLDAPAPRSWILLTFFISYVVMLAEAGFDALWLPDVLALTLIFWCIRRPQIVGMLIAFLCGILMDVAHGSVLGQQSLAYVVIAYLAYLLHRRLPWFGLIGQALHVLPLLLLSQLLVMLARLWFDGLWPGWSWFLQSLTGALLWPLWSMLLSMRREQSSRESF